MNYIVCSLYIVVGIGVHIVYMYDLFDGIGMESFLPSYRVHLGIVTS